MLQAEKAKALAIRNGEIVASQETFEDFAAEFLKYQRKRISPEVIRGKLSAAEYERQRGIIETHLMRHFGPMRLAAIRRVHVVRYIHARTGAVADGTLIKEVNTLKRMLSVALDLEKIGSNPARRIDLPTTPKGRTRYLSPDEWKRVFAACELYNHDWSEVSRLGKLNKKRLEQGLPQLALANAKPLPSEEQWLQQAVGLAVSLGTRRGELMNVTLADIELDRHTILLRKTKSGKPRQAFINDLAMLVLGTMGVAERKGRAERGLLFPDITPTQVTVAFRRACKRAEIEDFSLTI